MGSRRRRHAALVTALACACGCGSASAPTTALGNKSDGAAGGAVALTWVVSEPSVPHPQYDDMLLRPLTLEVTVNGATRSIELEPQMGALYPYNQVVCKTDAYPLLPGEVAKITFYEGGGGGYAIAKSGSESIKRELEDKLVVLEWSLTDGACEGPGGEPVACPRHEKTVTTMQVPSRATIGEAIVEVDAKGARKPFSCAELQ